MDKFNLKTLLYPPPPVPPPPPPHNESTYADLYDENTDTTHTYSSYLTPFCNLSSLYLTAPNLAHWYKWIDNENFIMINAKCLAP